MLGRTTRCTNLAPLRLHVALGNAAALLHVERTLHIDPEHALDRWLAATTRSGWSSPTTTTTRTSSSRSACSAGCGGARADIYRPLRNSLVLVNLLGFVVFWLYPVAPPRMLAGFTDVVASTHAFGSWHTRRARLAGQPARGDALAAHGLGGLVHARAVARQRARWVRALAVAYPA